MLAGEILVFVRAIRLFVSPFVDGLFVSPFVDGLLWKSADHELLKGACVQFVPLIR